LKKYFLLLLALPIVALAQGRKYSNAFLEIGVDARALGLSKAVIASANGVDAAYWNPAGLTAVNKGWQAAAMHAEYFASIAQYDYIGFAAPIDATSTAAVTIIRFGVDDILDTTELIDENGNVDYDRIQRFSAADYALLASYARKSKRFTNLSYGVNAKIVYRQIGEYANAIGFGFDVGAQYQLGKWKVGANLRDVTSTFNAWSYNDEKIQAAFTDGRNELPTENLELTIPRLLLGGGRTFQLNDKYSLHTELAADITFDGQRNTLVTANFGNVDPAFGVELGYRQFVFLRAGVGNTVRQRDFNNNLNYAVQPNLGIGFMYKGIAIDYALTNIGSATGALYSNIFSVKFNFEQFQKS
jgi:hypothetical protein